MFDHVTTPEAWDTMLTLDTHVAMTHGSVIDGGCSTCVDLARSLGVDLTRR